MPILLHPNRTFRHTAYRSGSSTAAFTFVEIVVAVAIAAVVIATAVLAFQAISRSGSRWGVNGDVELSSGIISNLYGLNGSYVATSFAPNFGMAAQAESMRERLYEDVASASAIYCLGRNGRSSIRPETLDLPENIDARSISTPAVFQTFLASAEPSSAGVFTTYQGASAAPNSSLFILTTSTNTGQVNVRAVYEVDMITTTNPAGVYASVRRYQGAVCTDFYHVFYEGAENTFQPLMAYFEKDATVATGSPEVDRFKQAANRPFYFVWWPDPAAPRLDGPEVNEIFSSYQPRAAYANMANRTSFFFVLPAFPRL